jgi:holo-[acyl-carrier protein] synthase
LARPAGAPATPDRQTTASPGETRTPATVYDRDMQIIGIGLDATEIPRIADTMARFGDRFLHRIFTDGEIAYCQAHRRASQHFAARFAVKEAAMKALGTGHSHGVLWKDVEVVRRAGPPQLELHGAAARRFDAMGGRSSVVTITHTDALAMAQVILMGEGSRTGGSPPDDRNE